MSNPNSKYRIKLSEEQRQELIETSKNGKKSAKKVNHANVLLMTEFVQQPIDNNRTISTAVFSQRIDRTICDYLRYATRTPKMLQMLSSSGFCL
jgi:hypothetical protein